MSPRNNRIPFKNLNIKCSIWRGNIYLMSLRACLRQFLLAEGLRWSKTQGHAANTGIIRSTLGGKVPRYSNSRSWIDLARVWCGVWSWVSNIKVKMFRIRIYKWLWWVPTPHVDGISCTQHMEYKLSELIMSEMHQITTLAWAVPLL